MPEASPRGTNLVVAETLRNEMQAEQDIDILPSEADLMDSRSVSRNTIRRALKVLEADRVVESAPGSDGAWSEERTTGGRSRSA